MFDRYPTEGSPGADFTHVATRSDGHGPDSDERQPFDEGRVSVIFGSGAAVHIAAQHERSFGQQIGCHRHLYDHYHWIS